TRSKAYRELKDKRKNVGFGILPETQQTQSPVAEGVPNLVNVPIQIKPTLNSTFVSVSSISQGDMSSVKTQAGCVLPAAKSLGSLSASTPATSVSPRHNPTIAPRRTQSCMPHCSVRPSQGIVNSVPSQSATTPQWPKLHNSNYSHNFPVRSATIHGSSIVCDQQEVPVMLPLSMRFQQEQQLEYEKKQKALYHQHSSEQNILSPISPIKNWPDCGSELAPSNIVSLVERAERFAPSKLENVEALCVANELVSFSRAASMSISKLVD
ncbi:hypothetical protein HK100_004946, partial [Physocladia obscura]